MKINFRPNPDSPAGIAFVTFRTGAWEPTGFLRLAEKYPDDLELGYSDVCAVSIRHQVAICLHPVHTLFKRDGECGVEIDIQDGITEVIGESVIQRFRSYDFQPKCEHWRAVEPVAPYGFDLYGNVI